MPFDDRELLARLIQCEAGGEGEHGMAAVASVIMNRTHIPVGEFARVSNGGNVRNIIEQEGQFNCMMRVLNGDYNAQNIYNMNPTDVHYAIADWALAGNSGSLVGDSIFFYNPYSNTCPPNFPTNVGAFRVRIGNHCFYGPTELYSQT